MAEPREPAQLMKKQMGKIQVKDLSYKYSLLNGTKHDVLNEISFDVEKGEFVVLLGESGCGKSTLLGLLAGLKSPSSGEILVNGKRQHKIDPSISILFQRSTLLPWLNVRENIAFGCRIRKDLENIDDRVSKHSQMMGLQQYERNYPQELSVGTAKRVDIARALIGHPRVLLLDEPFAPLDYYTKGKLQDELTYIWHESGMSCVFVTHDIGEAVLLGQKILIMSSNPGRIEYTLKVEMDYPRNRTDPDFVELKNELLKQFGLISHIEE